MSTWVIGDVQGCCAPLEALLGQPDIAHDADARFWFAGDLVNRGPASLATLRRVMAMGDRAVAVLGNHDLHLLAVAAGLRKPGKSDTIQEILDAPDAADILTWLRHRPLAHFQHGHLMVHAGVLPSWTAAQTLALAGEVEATLRGPDWPTFLAQMYGNAPATWVDGLQGVDRLRVIVNALTRMRFCAADGTMEFAVKDAAKHAPPGFMPWFDVPGRATESVTVVFGHWSTLGLLQRPGLLGLDTGCVWGGRLTAARLNDHKLVQVACRQFQAPD
ncbi:Bis(5'-nucleosyl)-tetraphosphatase, symmetrical [Pigmentiphaga humi]|uniref:Bis(5'-nucleosyl)-tetraphosphatase, symmetrical n=1 Tax=Pigmentiphaga humi TaxID=2478468 RepID=A0A3P4B1E0_9BURK|nr:symmetrical bis(5'-nucleosyl)-tetraphosphatase [Pigmentiphaga humi]VCU70094.1 Bis(5'-nucleosyl)-tetraphosphatase, symmetrical [Pigmentiphaga humi]